jgi:NADPH2:quinone reductase
MFVSYGNASGAIEAFSINLLQTKGSLYVTRPTLIHYSTTRQDYLGLANELFDVVGSGKVRIPVNQTYALKDVQKAHRELESRATTGSSILVP